MRGSSNNTRSLRNNGNKNARTECLIELGPLNSGNMLAHCRRR